MMAKAVLSRWEVEGSTVKLDYSDGTILYVSKSDFDRAFGCIISASKEDVVRDFAVQY